MRIRSITRVLVLGACVAALGGCASSRKVYTPMGTPGHSITCSGSALNWGMCYEKAGQLCGERGYEVIEKTGDKGVVLSGNQFGLYAGSVITRNLLIQCK